MTTEISPDYKNLVIAWRSEIPRVYRLESEESLEGNKIIFEKALDESIIDLVKYNQIKDSEKDEFKRTIMFFLNNPTHMKY